MPDPPPVGLFTRYLLENPWPPAVVLLLAAAVIGWMGLRDGLVGRLRSACILAAAAVIVLAVGFLVTTPAEHAKRLTRRFVSLVVEEDLVGAYGTLAPEGGSLAVASVSNPGVDLEAFRSALSWVAGAYTIETNRITLLDAYTEASDRASVHLACWTEAEGGYAPVITQWVLDVRRQADGEWRISRVVWISINGKPATMGVIPG